MYLPPFLCLISGLIIQSALTFQALCTLLLFLLFPISWCILRGVGLISRTCRVPTLLPVRANSPADRRDTWRSEAEVRHEVWFTFFVRLMRWIVNWGIHNSVTKVKLPTLSGRGRLGAHADSQVQVTYGKRPQGS